MGLSDLPTLNERPRQACPKGKTRLETKADAKPLTYVDEKAFKKAVVDRDGYICRCCKRKVVATVTFCPERREIHHIHGRRGDLRFEARAALVLCGWCHGRCTGKVNDRLVIVATKTFTLGDRDYTDARFPVFFHKVA